MDILWVQALNDNGLEITFLTKKIHLFHTRLIDFEKKASSKKLMRTHRSWIVHIDHITQLIGRTLYVDKQVIPIGKTYWETVRKRLNLF